MQITYKYICIGSEELVPVLLDIILDSCMMPEMSKNQKENKTFKKIIKKNVF